MFLHVILLLFYPYIVGSKFLAEHGLHVFCG